MRPFLDNDYTPLACSSPAENVQFLFSSRGRSSGSPELCLVCVFMVVWGGGLTQLLLDGRGCSKYYVVAPSADWSCFTTRAACMQECRYQSSTGWAEHLFLQLQAISLQNEELSLDNLLELQGASLSSPGTFCFPWTLFFQQADSISAAFFKCALGLWLTVDRKQKDLHSFRRTVKEQLLPPLFPCYPIAASWRITGIPDNALCFCLIVCSRSFFSNQITLFL